MRQRLNSSDLRDVGCCITTLSKERLILQYRVSLSRSHTRRGFLGVALSSKLGWCEFSLAWSSTPSLAAVRRIGTE